MIEKNLPPMSCSPRVTLHALWQLNTTPLGALLKKLASIIQFLAWSSRFKPELSEQIIPKILDSLVGAGTCYKFATSVTTNAAAWISSFELQPDRQKRIVQLLHPQDMVAVGLSVQGPTVHD